MPALHIELKKVFTDRAALTCRRPDGTATWSRMPPFFPTHDLTHFAVETTLGIRRGFFGLIAEGWSLDDFTLPGVAARLPVEAHRTEVTVGAWEGLDPGGSHAEFCESLAAALAGQGLAADFAVTAENFAEIRRASATLHAQWAALPMGETLTLEFSPRG